MKCTTAAERRSLDAHEIKHKLMMVAIGVATIVATFLYVPFVKNGPILCPLRLLTGIPCPSCGLTRSFCAFAQGHIEASFTHHLLGPVLFFALLIGIPVLIFEVVTRRSMEWFQRVFFSRTTAFVLVGALLSYHSARLTALAIDGDLWLGMRESVLGITLGAIRSVR